MLNAAFNNSGILVSSSGEAGSSGGNKGSPFSLKPELSVINDVQLCALISSMLDGSSRSNHFTTFHSFSTHMFFHSPS